MSSFDLEKAKKDRLISTYTINLENLPIGDDDVLYICQNIDIKLINQVNLIGTNISDKVFECLAQFPKLEFLKISQTNITGQGFCHFAGHKKLEVIWAENTQLDDTILPLIAQIPNVTAFLIEGTKITWQGLLTLAKRPHIRPVARGGQFSDGQLAEFRHSQREFAKKNKTPVNADDLAKVTAQLLAFFEAIHRWEELAEPNFNDEMMQKSTEIYRQFFTESWHNTQRMSLQSGGTYKEHKIVGSEYISKNRIYLYTENGSDTPHRFLCIRQADDLWLFDKMQIKFDHKWTSYTP